jgi:hypothetical protein
MLYWTFSAIVRYSTQRDSNGVPLARFPRACL